MAGRRLSDGCTIFSDDQEIFAVEGYPSGSRRVVVDPIE